MFVQRIKDREGVATYYLTFKDADEYENKIKPIFEDVHLSALAVENKLDYYYKINVIIVLKKLGAEVFFRHSSFFL